MQVIEYKIEYRKLLSSFITWAERVRLYRKFAIALVLCSIISGVATYITITSHSNPFGPDPGLVVNFILVNMVFLLALAVMVSTKVIKLWLARVQGSIGSRLQVTIILMFSLVSIIPTIIITSFSTLFFNFGIQSWFNERVGTAIEESIQVADAYLVEHKEIIKADVLAMSYDLSRSSYLINTEPKQFNNILTTQAALRSLTEAIVFRKNRVLARSPLSFSLVFEVENIAPRVYTKVDQGDVVIITSQEDDRVRALVKLDNTFDTYLLVGRFVDSKILNHIERTKGSANEYKRLKSEIARLQVKFYIVFVGVALLILLAAIWFGMIIAAEFVKPISELVTATEQVKAGDLKARVKEGPKNDEIGALGRAFNLMTDQLEKQRSQLIDINTQIDERRRFTEAVLSGVSAGVIALGKDKTVDLINRSALRLLSVSAEKTYKSCYHDFFPEIDYLLEQAESSYSKVARGEIEFNRNNRKNIFLVRIAVEEQDTAITGYIITFDDITELKQAERNRAWSDVARRIAHEIKNPLTPINLSAERLRRKYGDQIKENKENFDKYIDTIIAHVNDIGNMVEEFSQFARMPAPKLEKHDIIKIAKDSIFSQRSANAGIKYESDFSVDEAMIKCDIRQISQVFTNLLKNAAESIEIKREQGRFAEGEQGKIRVNIVVNDTNNEFKIEISDNGLGFPKDLISQLSEPYVTTKEKGTGLGLAIVKKIIDDHQGSMEFHNSDSGGARVILTL